MLILKLMHQLGDVFVIKVTDGKGFSPSFQDVLHYIVNSAVALVTFGHASTFLNPGFPGSVRILNTLAQFRECLHRVSP